ncbi:MAG: DUF1385 domain-containing protein [Anaerolineae bacterium]|jgi:uncharacterized protein YqhQ
MSERINYGGQAVIEGVMMRGKRQVAVAVREPGGKIRLRTEPLNPTLYAGPLASIPVLRGVTMLWDTLGLGMRALMWSADVAAGEDEVGFEGPAGWIAGLLGVGFGVGLFMVLPSFLVAKLLPSVSGLVANVLEGLVRFGVVLGYIWIVGRLPDVRRVFAYHGAEHKTINAYEAGDPLTVESVRNHSTAHPRCGTAFLLTVVVVSILVLAPLGRPPLVWRLVSRVLVIPLIAGISYEFIRFSARHAERPWLNWLIRPSLELQHMTTSEPEDEMVEVAIQALLTVLEAEAPTKSQSPV